MKNVIMIIPIGKSIGLTSVSLGLVEKFKREKINVGFLKSVFECSNDNTSDYDHSSMLIQNINSVQVFKPFKVDNIDYLIQKKMKQQMMDHILSKIDHSKKLCDIILLEGVSCKSSDNIISSNYINLIISQNTYAEIIFLCSLKNSDNTVLQSFVDIINCMFKARSNINIKGVIINEMFTLNDHKNNLKFLNLFDIFQNKLKKTNCSYRLNNIYSSLFRKNSLKILSIIPCNFKLMEPTVDEFAFYMTACSVKTNCISKIRFIKHFVLYEPSNSNYDSIKICEKYSESLLIISFCFLNHLKFFVNHKKNSTLSISAILIINFSDSCVLNKDVLNYLYILNCPIFSVEFNTLETVSLLKNFCFKILDFDLTRLNITKEYFCKYLDLFKIDSLNRSLRLKNYISPLRFIYNLKKLASRVNKNIILPEGNELRIIKAAIICENNNIANCTLLGNPKEIRRIAVSNNINLNSKIKILDPKSIRNKYIKRLVDLRYKHGMNLLTAKKCVKDDLILSTLVLEAGEVDGLVAGSINTTSRTILPAFQLIKTASNTSLISSVFFMLLSDHVLLYADCAINPNPDSIQLAEVAIQSANTAFSFGLLPRIAMLSYSTGESSDGYGVDKIKQATEIVKKLRPDLIIDGPIQYDAAIDTIIAKTKNSYSKVSGCATVFIFPDLNSGNITYKAVQNSNNSIAIGPILQGIKKPVNDLSRGASIEDIVYTIAVTAIQASHY